MTITTNTAVTVPVTIEAALRALDSWTELTVGERRDARSALAKIIQQDGRPAGAIALTPAVVRETILCRDAAVLGVQSGSKSNIVWQLGRVMRRLGLIAAEKSPFSEAWTALLDRFGSQERAKLTALARWCSACQIAPAAVDAAVLAALLGHLETRTLTPRPGKTVGAARGAWNRYCKTIPDWPGHPLPVPRAAPPVLPAAYHADRSRFCARLRGPSRDNNTFVRPLEGQDRQAQLKACPRPLRESTIALRGTHCDWAAYTLVASGFPAEAITGLAVLVDNAGAILERLFDDAGQKPSARGMHVAEVLLMIARHDLHAPEADITWIQQMASLHKLTYHGITEKNDRCVLAALDPVRDEKLLALPGALMAAAHDCLASDPQEAAGLAWRAVTIEILLTIPLRLANIQKLRLDQHLYRADPRRGRIAAFMIPPPEAKTGKPIQVPVSPALAAMLAIWISTFRPHIADPAGVYLFPGYGTGNAPLTPQAMRDAVKRVTGQHAGVVLSPHQFRHLAAERFLRDHPGEYETLRRLLGHASTATTTRAYARSENRTAHERFDALVAEKRSHLRRAPKPPAGSRRGPKAA